MQHDSDRDIIGTRAWHEAEADAARVEYEEEGEPDGCWYCGGPHPTSGCHA